MKKKGLVILLGLTLIMSMTACKSNDSSKELKSELEALSTQIEETNLENLSKEEKESVEKLQKEYSDKISNASSKDEANKLKSEYDSMVKDATSGKVKDSEKENVKDEIAGSKPNNNSTSIKPSSGNTQTNTSDKNNNTTTKPATDNSGGNTSSTSKPNNNTSGGNTTTPPQTGGNTNTGGSNNPGTTTKPEEPKERTVTVKVPVYGDQYKIYWIKDNNKNIIFETRDSNEWDNKCLEYWDKGILISYGSEGKSDIVGYNEYTLTESEYYESNFSTREDVIVTWN